jgi:undecaprenyl-diphosphatase
MRNLWKIITAVIIYEIFAIFLILSIDKVVALDSAIFFSINSIRNPLLDVFFTIITYAGSSVFWILLIILLWLKGRNKISLRLIYVFILDTISLYALKWFFMRPRPFESFSKLEFLSPEIDVGPSFPSGHSQRAFPGATVLSKYKKFRILLFILAFLVALSRVYLGMHYPIDTIIGAINGVILGLIVSMLPTKSLEKKLEEYRKRF